jgi:hypothetical protein
MPIIAGRASAAYGAGFSRVVTAAFTPVGSFDALGTVTVGAGGLTSITFAGIPQNDYTHLQIRQTARTNLTSPIQTGNALEFNSDTSANYAVHRFSTDGTTLLGEVLANETFMYYSSNTGNNADANQYGVAIIDILDYRNANKFKTARVITGTDLNGEGRMAIQSGLWRSTSPIYQIKINCRDGGSFIQYSNFTLYGVK